MRKCQVYFTKMEFSRWVRSWCLASPKDLIGGSKSWVLPKYTTAQVRKVALIRPGVGRATFPLGEGSVYVVQL